MTDNEIRQEIELSELASEKKAVYNLGEIRKLERRIETLVKLVERIGKDFDAHCNETCHEPGGPLYWPYTVEGQREYDAALHSAGVEPPDAVSVGAWGAI